MKKHKLYIDSDGAWTKEAQKELGVPYESLTIYCLEELIKKGFFLKKRKFYPGLSFQKITFIELPKEIFDRLTYLLVSINMATQIDRTGYIWLFGYPVIYK